MGQVNRYLEALRSRGISFRFLQGKLKDFEIESAQGWPKLLHKHRNDPADPEVRSGWLRNIFDLYMNHLLYGDKAVAIYDIGQDEINQLMPFTDDIVTVNSPYLNAYPFSLEAPELRLMSSIPNPVQVINNDNDGSKRIVFCSKRFIKSREDLDINTYEPDVRTALAGYDEIIGIRCGHIQGFDFIQLSPVDGRLEVHVDASNKLSTDDIVRAQMHFRHFIEDWLTSLNLGVTLGEPRDFLPMVRVLYDSPDGCVSSLGHSTASASLKEERMRRRNTDLRTEPFHLGGLAGVNNLTDLYSITKNWPGENQHAIPGVTIPGHFSNIGVEGTTVDYALITGCEDETDFMSVMSKLG